MLKKRVLYNDFTNIHRLQIINELYTNQKWDPIYISGQSPSSVINKVKEKYPSCLVQDSMELRKAQFDFKDIGKPVPIDERITDSLSKYEFNFLEMLGNFQDSTGWNYSFEERKNYYFDILRYWNTVIKNLKPDIFVSFALPHAPNCYSLYLLCKYYGIDVLFLDPIPLLNQNYHLVGISIEDLHAPIIDTYNSTEKLKLSDDVSQYFNELRSKNAKMPNYIIENLNIFEDYSPIFRFRPFIELLFLTLCKGTGFLKHMDIKKNKKPYYMFESRMNMFEYFLYVESIRRKSKRLIKYYKPLCVTPDFNKKYIYFAASYQPEASTATNAGAYKSFLLTLDMLSNIIPNDWVIYYKENPTTFSNSHLTKGAKQRNKYYYERINTYKNINLVSSDISTFDLIDYSQVVATVSGTVAWEAAIRGKPALSFGSAWYMGCKSIFKIKTMQDAREALKLIIDGFNPEQKDIERYAAAIEKVAVKSMLLRDFYTEIEKCVDQDYELARIANAIKKAHEKHYS